jgi:hypothetical protein
MALFSWSASNTDVAAPHVPADRDWQSIRQRLLSFLKWTSELGVALAVVSLAVYAVYSIVFPQTASRPEPEELRWANEENVVADEKQRFKDLLACDSHLERSELADKCNLPAIYNPDSRQPTVAVYSSPSSKPAPPPLTLKELSDTGQAHAIDFIGKGHGSADTAWLKLTKATSGLDSDREGKDPYRVDRVLVATVTKGVDANPGDRFLWTRVFVQPINFQFLGYTLTPTDNQTPRVVSIESTKSHKLGFDVGLDAGVPGLPKPNVSQSMERADKATADVNSQYEKLGVDIRSDFLRIIRESAPGGDVAGNTAIELSILTDPTTIRKSTPEESRENEKLVLRVTGAHLTDGIKYLGPQDARITVLPEEPLPHCPLKAKVWMLYEKRQIKLGGAHYTEGFQRVELVKDGEAVHAVEIVPADDIAPAVWSIRMSENGRSSTLQAKTAGATKRDLVFTDYVMASQLIHWLKGHPSTSVNKLQEIEFPDYNGQTLVPYKNVHNDCDPQDVDRN